MGSKIDKLDSEKKRKEKKISEGTTSLSPTSSLHSHQKEDGSYEKIGAQGALPDDAPKLLDIVTIKQLREILVVRRALVY